MKKNYLTELKIDIQIKAKKGVDFILAASIVWLLIAFIWATDYASYDKSVFTFMIGAILLPLAFGLSKVLKTQWKIKDNPLQPLGLWLNFAQLIYFPFLIFILIRYPDYFIMAYAIITGAHLFPYAWFYGEIAYSVAAISISLSALLLALNVSTEDIWLIAAFTSCLMLLLASYIFISWGRLVKTAGLKPQY